MKFAIQPIRIILMCLAACPVHFVVAQSQDRPPSAEGQLTGIKVTLFCNDYGELTSPEKSSFHRETFLDFNDMLLFGLYKDYNKENKLIGDGFYERGLKKGIYTEYFENGSVKSTIENEDHGFILWGLTNERRENEVVGGSGKFSMRYREFKKGTSSRKLTEGILDGEFQNGKRIGKWTYTDPEGKKTDEELYEKGLLIRRITFSESGTMARESTFNKPIAVSLSSLPVEALRVDPSAYTHLNHFFEENVQEYPGILNRRMTFPGGLNQLLILIASNLNVRSTGHTYPARLTVNKHGHLRIRLPPYIDQDLEDEFMRVIKPYEHQLLPAVKNGRPYKSSIRVPITNSLDWIDFLHTASTEEVIADLAHQWYNL